MPSLDIGCGRSKRGDVGMDIYPAPGVDVVHDLRRIPWPFADESFDKVIASHVLEHIPRDGVQFEDSIFRIFAEVYRILRPGGEFYVIVPHEKSRSAWGVPTHQRVFSEISWTFFSKELWSKASGLEASQAPCVFNRVTFRVDREFGFAYGLKEWHVEKHLPRFYQFLCAIRFGRKRNIYARFMKDGGSS